MPSCSRPNGDLDTRLPGDCHRLATAALGFGINEHSWPSILANISRGVDLIPVLCDILCTFMNKATHLIMESFSEKKSTQNATTKTSPGPRSTNRWAKLLWTTVIAILVLSSSLYYRGVDRTKGELLGLLNLGETEKQEQIVRKYSLQIGSRWMNPDGGRWRVMFVCNGQTPCPTLKAQEGDLVELTVHSDSYFQSSIHWSGVGYRHTEAWNDGTAGLSQFPMLPRGNHTNVHDTTGAWGSSWYADHTTAASADGLYGMIYVAPDPARPRPYKLITDNPLELRQIMEAEQNIRHLAIKNHMHRDTNWKLLQMRAEGTEFYCYDSLLVNGKGRNLCRAPGFEELNGQSLDETGCIQPAGFPPASCSPSAADFEVIGTDGQEYIMLNLVNVGIEHEVRVAIDHHKIFIVATDGGFVEPIQGDVIYIASASRLTILVKLDQQPGDYAMRISSTSQLQNLQGFAILRYPAKRQPILGQPMQLPNVDADDLCLQPDSSVKAKCNLIDGEQTRPYPPSPPSHARNSRADGAADFTFHLSAGVQKSQTEKFAPEYFLNEKPWQLFRGAMQPLLFTNMSSPSAQGALEKPVIHGLPIGSVVDLVIENQLNDTVPLYKHGRPAWLLGSRAHANFSRENVLEAVNAHEPLKLRDPPLVVVHDLPPLGWSVLRFEVTTKAATMLHAVKLRYFVLGMSAPILEGITAEDPITVPESAQNRPHVNFEPKNDGVFG